MPEQTSFTLLYKRLLEANFYPDPLRVRDTLRSLKHELFFAPPRESDQFSVDFPEKNV